MAEELPKAVAEKRRNPWWKVALKFILWTGGIVVFLLLSLVGLTFIFENDIKGYVTNELNSRLNTTIVVDPENIDLTLIRNFPNASVEFKNVTALDAWQLKKRDTLFNAGKISLSFSILDIFRENYTIRNISIEDGMVDVRIDSKGRDNYHFLKEDSTAKDNDSSQIAFALDEIIFTNVDMHYTDKQSESMYKFHIDDLSFAGDFSKGEFDLATEADFRIDELKQKNISLFKGNKGHLELGMGMNTTTGFYSISTGKLQIADLLLDLSGSVTNKTNNYLLDISIKGQEVDIQSALSLAPASFQKDISEFESSGEFYFEASVKGLSGDTLVPDIEAKFGIKDGATITRKNTNITLKNVSLKGYYTNAVGKEKFELSSFNATTGRSKFSGSFGMNGVDKANYSASINGTIDLAEMQEILQADTIEKAAGVMEIHFEGSGTPASGKELTVADFRKFKTGGEVRLHEASVKLKNSTVSADSINGELTFDGNNVDIKNFSGNSTGSDFQLNGNVKNLLGYLFTDEEYLDVNADFSSRNLDLNKLLSGEEKGQGSDTSYQLVLPDRLKFHLTSSIKHISFRRFDCNGFTGEIDLKDQRLYANNLNLRTMDGTITGNGMIDGTKEDSLLITCTSKISKVNITKLFYVFENFGQTEGDETIGDKNVSGLLTSDVTFVSMWDNKLNVNEKKIYTFADVLIDKGELKNFKPLEALSKFISIDELKDIKFNTLHNTFEIKNRIVNMPKMEIQSSAIDLTMSGTHDFDNIVDYHFIISMDEIRAKKAKTKKENNEFGEEEMDGTKRYRLYVSMKGPVDNPEIKYIDAKGFIQQKKEEIKQEKQNVKNILNQEFGWFKNDSAVKKEDEKKNKDKKDPNTINLKKGKDEEDAPEGEDF